MGSRKADCRPEHDHSIKMVVVGEPGSGKSNLIQRLVHDHFDERSPSTIGIDFARFEFRTEDLDLSSPLLKHAPHQTYEAQIWDTAGMERYRSSMTKIFYRDVLGALLVFDLTNRHHFEALPRWLEEIRTNVQYSADSHRDGQQPEDIPILLVGNKLDLDYRRAVQRSEALRFVHENRLAGYIETSAKTSVNVSEAFRKLFQAIIEPRQAEPQVPNPLRPRASIRLSRERHRQYNTDIQRPAPARSKPLKKSNKCSC